MQGIWRLLFFGLAVVLASTAARAEERITSFHVEIRVEPEGSLLVTESISVNAEGRRIRRGIYRDFPTIYRRSDGSQTKVGFELISALRDGVREEVDVSRMINGLRIRLGRSTTLLEPGIHHYILRYRTSRQLYHSPDADELYWNVTGNGWEFSIDSASAVVILPPGAGITDYVAYTGYAGERGGDYETFFTENDSLAFRTTRGLAPREGLTIVASWPPGFVERPGVVQKAAYFLLDNADIFLAWIGFLALFGYYYLTWRRVGRDPEEGTIITQYEPPKGVSPATASFLVKMDYSSRAFTAAIVNMAVQGYHKISETGGDNYHLERRSKRPASALSQGERAIGIKLYLDGDFLSVDNDNFERFQAAKEAHERALKREHEHIHFVRNGRYFYVGLVVAFLVFLGVGITLSGLKLWLVPPILGIMIMVPTFYFLLKRPTLKGRRIMDEIEGFKRYLSVAEKDRMAFHNPPEQTPEIFEKYLPYAIALKVEDQWGEAFEDVLSAAALAEGGAGYSPLWYSGGGRGRFRPAAFSHSMAAGFSSAISSASQPPSASGSGFGGGGFSGGGGGGGGGGGW